ncbi:hypothetical protein JAAARDRAFT_61801 [Jaapia argillacea MUCL 33604]|uniref:Uncharacterized protein n=1 Tax=Jaapia argillacea MUCL 33604 TaxID=933084 RepID=A0A067PMV2_9AGAM|nr:hypothetical protein JAAARDRAFT_61801 [Jaapia argillacea MUCL 33604]
MVGADGLTPAVLQDGLLLAANSSVKFQAITLADSTDAAIIVPSDTESDVQFRAQTYGLRAQCHSLNAGCAQSGGDTSHVQNCSNLGVPELPYTPPSGNIGDQLVSIVMVRMGSTNISSSGGSWQATHQGLANPVTALLQLRWSSFIDGGLTRPNDAIDVYPIPSISMYAQCTLSFFQATIQRSVSTTSTDGYVISDEQPTDANFTALLVAPIVNQYVTLRLVSNIQAQAMADTNVASVEATLSQELGRLGIGMTGGMLMLANTLDQQVIHQTLVSRYPLAPALTFVLLLYVYALLTLWIVVWAVGVKSEVFEVEIPAGRRKNVLEVELVQLRLTNPMPIIAALFPPDDKDLKAQLSVQTDVLGLFIEHKGERDARLLIGLQEEGERIGYGLALDRSEFVADKDCT